MRLLPILLSAAVIPAITAVAEDKAELGNFKWSQSQDERLGISVIGINDDLRAYFRAPKGQGVLVAQVIPKSTADAAGLRVGDVITKLGNAAVEDAGDIIERMGKIGGNAKLAVEVVRERQVTRITVIVGAVQPKPQDRPAHQGGDKD